MKIVLLPFYLLLLGLVFSCQSSEERVSPEAGTTPAQVSEKWRLVKIIGTGLSPAHEIPFSYEETYEFRANGTFRRYRSTGYEATGTYKDTLYDGNAPYVVVTFDQPELGYHGLSWFKHPKAKVSLSKRKGNELVESYIAFDGPEFYYQKIDDKKE
jgi:hypothetical protein